MNIRDLHYFVVLAEVKHFGDAAKKCFVSQPTLSMQIKKLEESLGVTLFERTNKQVLLTDQGDALLSRVKKILMLIDEMKDVARHLHDPFAGNLRMGVIPTVAPYLLPRVMPAIKAQFPELKIWLIEDQTQRLVDQLEHGKIDVAIMAYPVEGNFTSYTLFEEEFYFVCDESNDLAKSSSISIAQLVNQPMMLLEEGHCLREQAMAVCKMAKNQGIADFRATSLETLRLMVQSGMGVTLLPALSLIADPSQRLKYIPFEAPAPARTLALFWRSGTPKLKCLEAIGEKISRLIAPQLSLI
ncbi:LysR family transcriptional regulator [Legionella sp. km535]|uniref:LysR substrate-binding domain-containing protein n=1 Tax=Legionella sp. km535 TaxID=2498107 RepID=UPI000F8E276A|nr:LysR substrate-binding domain-containing protein [Legionella sp. km535]RUR18828.1 LysR family transcriptional regulator [Legionella sp. km535]